MFCFGGEPLPLAPGPYTSFSITFFGGKGGDKPNGGPALNVLITFRI